MIQITQSVTQKCLTLRICPSIRKAPMLLRSISYCISKRAMVPRPGPGCRSVGASAGSNAKKLRRGTRAPDVNGEPFTDAGIVTDATKITQLIIAGDKLIEGIGFVADISGKGLITRFFMVMAAVVQTSTLCPWELADRDTKRKRVEVPTLYNAPEKGARLTGLDGIAGKGIQELGPIWGKRGN
ncbi:unnamed protein product [Peronospora belbahrii]|uniref:Uncharacterized protein n=1 Tax=Peronospora belbahrii TaxID=622444 RepID=A0ABN8CQK1_9STRA|nr:unnamed protein product [Peronospora belbahrii]